MKGLQEIFNDREIVLIAEIGLNHNGDIDTALEMVDKAVEAKADAVKFQVFVPEQMYSSYTSSLLQGGEEDIVDYSQVEFFRKLVLSEEEYKKIIDRCMERKVVFFASVFDGESVGMMERLNVPLYKVASSEASNHYILDAVAETGKPVIMSTGITTEDEIEMAVNKLHDKGVPDIVLMHCVSLYPMPKNRANLTRIMTLKNRFGLTTGFSDHSTDNRSSEIAAALGARIFEKHFTLGGDFDCPDKAVSMDAGQFRKLRYDIENVIEMLGDGRISYDFSEKEVAKSARRSLFSRSLIEKGKNLRPEDVIAKRPGVGMATYEINKILGKKSNRDIQEDHVLKEEYFE